MVKGRMSLPGIWPVQQVGHGFLPLGGCGRDGLLERLVETGSVWQRLWAAKRKAHVAQIVDRHARHDDEDILLAETGHSLSELVVLIRVLGVEEGHLHNGDIQWV